MDVFQRVFVRKYLIQVIVIHIVTLTLGVVLFTPGAFFFALFLFVFFGGSMGIFHHMLMSHRSFKAKLGYERLGSLLGTLTWRGPFASPVRYVALHRVHHRYSDKEQDPHSPAHGWFHSWMGWFWNMPKAFTEPLLYEKYAGRIAHDPWHKFFDRHVDLIQFLWGLACFSYCAFLPILSGEPMNLISGLRAVVYGVFVKSLMIIYAGNAVDLINHSLGYRNFETRDRSTNSFLMAFVHLGGAISWHNNHHAYPRYFSVREKWWELDIYLLFLRFVEQLGLVWDIRVRDAVSGGVKKTEEIDVRDFMQPTGKDTSKMIAQALALWFVPALMAVAVWNIESLSLLMKALLMCPLMIVAAHGIHSTGLIGHEGTHFTLHRDRLMSSQIGVLISSLVPLHFHMGFAVLHSEHHRWANTEKDPDFLFFGKFKIFWSRLLFARIASGLRYSRLTWALALNLDGTLAEHQLAIGLSRENLVKLSRLNLAVQYTCLFLYAYLTWSFPIHMAIAVWIPTLFTILISGLRPYVEHAGTSSDRDLCARSWISPLFDFLYGGINYHLAHHLYPNVPGSRIRQLHHTLVANGTILNDSRIEARSLKEFITAASAPMTISDRQ